MSEKAEEKRRIRRKKRNSTLAVKRPKIGEGEGERGGGRGRGYQDAVQHSWGKIITRKQVLRCSPQDVLRPDSKMDVGRRKGPKLQVGACPTKSGGILRDNQKQKNKLKSRSYRHSVRPAFYMGVMA